MGDKSKLQFSIYVRVLVMTSYECGRNFSVLKYFNRVGYKALLLRHTDNEVV